MAINIVLAALAAVAMVVVGFVLGNKNKGKDNTELLDSLRSQIAELNEKLKKQEATVYSQTEQIKTLTSERDVQKANADNYNSLLNTQKADFEKQHAP